MFSGQRRNEFNRGIEYDTRQSPPVTVECGRRRLRQAASMGTPRESGAPRAGPVREVMNISLKTKNIPKLLIVWAVNVAVFSGVVKGVLDVWDVEALRGLAAQIAQDPAAGWPYVGLVTIVSIFNGSVPRPIKERLVFWTKPRPGCRAFSELMLKDSTIDRKALQEHFGPLPTDPDEQNALWVKWLNEFSDDIRVGSTYGMYLFTRDWTTIAAITLALATPAALWLSEDSVQALSYGGFVLLQYAFAAWVARVQGEQLVMSVMSCKGTSLNIWPGDKKKKGRGIK